jgi:hypothetical protein
MSMEAHEMADKCWMRPHYGVTKLTQITIFRPVGECLVEKKVACLVGGEGRGWKLTGSVTRGDGDRFAVAEQMLCTYQLYLSRCLE